MQSLQVYQQNPVIAYLIQRIFLQFVQGGHGGICSHHAVWTEDVLGDAKASIASAISAETDNSKTNLFTCCEIQDDGFTATNQYF